ncbi:transmembrane protein 253 isoform X1 [Xiphias gladius]|uniref:transmembrane protein 253 isoform X1 n=1 Tax=Xiphias gladius TaxID=8245 RepID=UPI001A97FADC|nr:transmembrane protein 253 isoform X1 [Xiphias gladius]
MTQNMFQEGLYHVFFKETPPTRLQTQVTNHQELDNIRLHRWFGTVVKTRLVVTGVVQVLSALACVLTTVTHACVSYKCSVSMTTPVWPSLFYVAAGCLAMEVQRKANKLKIITLMSLNLFSLVFGFSALLANSLRSTHPVALNTYQQRAGSYVAKGSSIAFSVQCFLASVYILFLSWRGLRRYSSPHIQAYSRLSQDPDETSGPLLEQVEFRM